MGKKGKKGQRHRAAPFVQSYKTPPASDVVVKTLDGDVVRTEPARDPEKEPWRRRKSRKA